MLGKKKHITAMQIKNFLLSLKETSVSLIEPCEVLSLSVDCVHLRMYLDVAS